MVEAELRFDLVSERKAYLLLNQPGEVIVIRLQDIVACFRMLYKEAASWLLFRQVLLEAQTQCSSSVGSA